MIPEQQKCSCNICLAIALTVCDIKNNVETAINTLNIVSIAFLF
jgi:hypothetical protein